jgi:hypothetical protein
MPLIGQAAMLLSFDVVDEALAEHDDLHRPTGWHA